MEWFRDDLREDVKYYFADVVRKGGEGGTPQIRNLFLAPPGALVFLVV